MRYIYRNGIIILMDYEMQVTRYNCLLSLDTNDSSIKYQWHEAKNFNIQQKQTITLNEQRVNQHDLVVRLICSWPLIDFGVCIRFDAILYYSELHLLI